MTGGHIAFAEGDSVKNSGKPELDGAEVFTPLRDAREVEVSGVPSCVLKKRRHFGLRFHARPGYFRGFFAVPDFAAGLGKWRRGRPGVSATSFAVSGNMSASFTPSLASSFSFITGPQAKPPAP